MRSGYFQSWTPGGQASQSKGQTDRSEGSFDLVVSKKNTDQILENIWIISSISYMIACHMWIRYLGGVPLDIWSIIKKIN